MENLKEIWLSHLSYKEEIIKKTKLVVSSPIKFYLATDIKLEYHLLIIEFNIKIDEISKPKKKFNGVDVFFHEKTISISLKDNSLLDTFDLFVKNIINEIQEITNEHEIFNNILSVLEKWRLLFGKLIPEGLNLEQQKGLLGELIFMLSLIENEIPKNKILNAWTGPDFEDKDFTFGINGVEVKYSTSKIPRVAISSERQLDKTNFDNLYLVHIKAEKVLEKGVSLKDSVNRLRILFSENKINLKLFNELIEKVGYFDIHDENYQTEYKVNIINNYLICDDFPRIVKKNISKGIYDVKYYIEEAAIALFIKDMNDIIKLIKNG